MIKTIEMFVWVVDISSDSCELFAVQNCSFI